MGKSIRASINSMSFRGKLVICAIVFFLIGLGVSSVLLVNLPLFQTPETVNKVYGRIQYSGEWGCAYGDPANPTVLNGAGDSIINLTSLGNTGNIYIIILNVQKLDNSTEPLIITIITEDGTVVTQASTDTPYGWARVGYDFQENTEPTFLETEQLMFDNVSWDSNLTYVDITVRNVGTVALTIVNLYMNDMLANNVTYTSGSANINSEGQATLRVAENFTSGIRYSFRICTAPGYQYRYEACAP